jgi:hypothetical protein
MYEIELSDIKQNTTFVVPVGSVLRFYTTSGFTGPTGLMRDGRPLSIMGDTGYMAGKYPYYETRIRNNAKFHITTVTGKIIEFAVSV